MSFSTFARLSPRPASLDFKSLITVSCPALTCLSFCSRPIKRSFSCANDVILEEFCSILFCMSARSCSSFEIDSLASLRELDRFLTFSSTLSLFVEICDCSLKTWLISESIEASCTFVFFFDSLTSAIEFFNSDICESKMKRFS